MNTTAVSNENEYLCELHKKYDQSVIYPLSPCRFKCSHCKNKRIHGYSNPEHISNPFGYLYLAPMYCIDCTISLKRCMWCI